MKQIIIAVFILMVSCSRTDEPVTTVIEMKTTDYNTGAPYPWLSFKIKKSYGSGDIFIDDSTNDYGNYHGSFQHEKDQNVEFYFEEDVFFADYLPAITPGSVNTVNLEIVPTATLRYELDCSGPGVIQNLQCTRVVPLPAHLGYEPQATMPGIYSPDCAYNYPERPVFSGEWKISREWKPFPEAASWIVQTDTITIAPGQDYVYMIVY